ncbi:MAG: spermidine/putrescine ABC transporter substrate-binding protein [bacterium]|nr:spermidine/putrescine ABC transporter substrate-binding protein [bacterium]
MRRIVFALCLCLAMMGLAATAAPFSQGSFWSCPRGLAGQTLNVYNWTTYIAEDTISNFERICGVTVVYDTYGSDSEMVDALRSGEATYDVVVPSNSTVYVMIEEGLLQVINFNNVPNFVNVAEQFRNPPHDPQNAYTVPYQWGTIGIGYNRTALGREITTWEEVFTGTARVAWLDEYRPMLGFANLLLGHDPNTSSADEINAAADYLIENSANVVAIAPDTGQDLLLAGEVDIAIEYSGDIFQIIGSCGCDDYAYVIPDEGAQIWTDSMAIPRSADQKALAEAFIDYILYAQVGADISNYTAYASPNQAAINEGLIADTYLNNPGIYPAEAVIGRLFYNVSSSGLDMLYSSAWDDIRAAVAR